MYKKKKKKEKEKKRKLWETLIRKVIIVKGKRIEMISSIALHPWYDNSSDTDADLWPF